MSGKHKSGIVGCLGETKKATQQKFPLQKVHTLKNNHSQGCIPPPETKEQQKLNGSTRIHGSHKQNVMPQEQRWPRKMVFSSINFDKHCFQPKRCACGLKVCLNVWLGPNNQYNMIPWAYIKASGLFVSSIACHNGQARPCMCASKKRKKTFDA